MIASPSLTKKIACLCLILPSVFASSFVFADDDYKFLTPEFDMTMRPFISLGGGAANSSDMGISKTFPLKDPVTDQIFNYYAKSASQTEAIGDVLFGMEWALKPNFNLQVGLAYNQTSAFTARGNISQGPDSSSMSRFTYKYLIQPRQIMLETKLLGRTCQIYHPYLLLGIGMGINSAYNYSTTVPPTLTYTQEFGNTTKHSFSYRAGAGVDVDLSPGVRLGLGYVFADFGAVNTGNATISGVPVPRALTQNSFYVNELLAELTFLYG